MVKSIQYLGKLRLAWIGNSLADIYVDNKWLGSVSTVAQARQRWRHLSGEHTKN